jgi:16S rRNA processing protein RimM
VRGWLRVAVDEPEVLAAQSIWWLGGVEYAVRETKLHSGTLLAKLAGIENPEQAKALKGRPVVIPRPEAGEGRYFWTDLVGLEVVNGQGVVLGVVKAMSSNGAHDVMEVAGDRSRLLPFVPAYVMKVDLQARRIEVDWQADW